MTRRKSQQNTTSENEFSSCHLKCGSSSVFSFPQLPLHHGDRSDLSFATDPRSGPDVLLSTPLPQFPQLLHRNSRNGAPWNTL